MTLLPFDDDPRKPVYARSGWEIPQLEWSEFIYHSGLQTETVVRQRTDSLLRDMARKQKRITRIRSVSTYLYNCVGMIFANRRAWIEIDVLDDILREDGYTKVALQQLEAGDIVSYAFDGSPTHVGLVTFVERYEGEVAGVTVLSKWGKDAEILHPMSDVPVTFGAPSDFWSERTPHVIG
ncbi:MAG: hypothetical protein OXG39_01205 [Chloroflexi bacterium]|nr:hypothetical protein [Chloroflexota bacterium]